MDLAHQNEYSWLRFTDYDTGEPLGFDPIAAYSPKRIRVSFKPKEIGEFNFDFQIENQNDSSNTFETKIHATVRKVMREETLVISTGNMLEFGDCAAGIWKKKSIVLRNVTEFPLEVALSSDNTTEIEFQLRGEKTLASSRRKRNDSRMTFELSHRSVSLLENFPGGYFNDRVSDSRTHSEVSIARTRSSTSSLDSNVVFDMGGGENLSDYDATDLERHETSSYTQPGEFDPFSIAGSPREVMGVGEDIARIEELIIRPGTERIIDVCYKPGRDQITSDFRACKLARQSFRLFLSHWTSGKQHEKEKSTIQCVARSCTSAIEISPATIQFGDTDVGTLKSSSIHIRNCSDLPAVVELRYISKVLSSIRGELVIPAKQSLEVKVDIYPRKVNTDYRKEICIANVLNPENDQVIVVHSTNIDQRRITFHSLFYHILTPQSTHFIDFGTAVMNSPVVRTFIIDNISAGDLTLDITSSLPSQMLVYKIADLNDTQVNTARVTERKERLLETIEWRRNLKRPAAELPLRRMSSAQKSLSNLGSRAGSVSRRQLGDIALSPSVAGSAVTSDYLDLASSKTQSESLDFLDKLGQDISKPLLSSILTILEKETGNIPPRFVKLFTEEAYVKLHQNLRHMLSERICEKQIVPASRIIIPARGQQLIVLVLTVPNIESQVMIDIK